MVANSAPHPAKLDGNGMEYLRKMDRNCMSSRMRMVVATIVLVAFFDAGGWLDDNAEDVDEAANRAAYFPR